MTIVEEERATPNRSLQPTRLRDGAAGDRRLEFRNVSKRFGSVQALAGCSFSVARGAMLGFLGPNGAGKTTAMRAVFGLVEPDAGEVLWDGSPIGLAERLRFGYMPEERGLYPRMPVGEQLEYFGRLHGLGAARGARGGSALARAARPRRSRRCEGRGALAREPAARAARRSAPARAGPARPRRAVRRPRPRRRAHARRGASQRGGARRGRALLEPSARARRGHLRGGRDHRPRPHRRDRRASTRCDEPRSAGGSSCELEGAPPDGCRTSAGVELVERRNGILRLIAGRDVDPEQVLAAAQRAGRVVEFSYGPPSLAELFLELVAPMNGRRTITLVARREIRERLRSRVVPRSRPCVMLLSSAGRRRCSGALSTEADLPRRGGRRRRRPGWSPRSQRAAKPFDDAKVKLRIVASPAAGREALDAEQVDALLLLPRTGSSFARTSTRRLAAVADTAVRALRRHLPPAPELTTATLEPPDDETDRRRDRSLRSSAPSSCSRPSRSTGSGWSRGVVEEKSNRVVEVDPRRRCGRGTCSPAR